MVSEVSEWQDECARRSRWPLDGMHNPRISNLSREQDDRVRRLKIDGIPPGDSETSAKENSRKEGKENRCRSVPEPSTEFIIRWKVTKSSNTRGAVLGPIFDG